MLKKNFFYLIILIFFISTLIFKISFLSDVTPTQDQTSYIYWLQSMFTSENFFPDVAGKNLIQSLQIDNKSFLHNLLKPIYSSTINIFTIISLVYFSIGSLILDASVKSQIILSILSNNISILIISLYFAKLGKKNKDFIALSILTFFILQLNSYFYGFSTHGTHNVGILFLIINLIFLENYLKKISSDKISLKNRFLYFFIQGLAFYSMYANVFLIISCSLIGILFLKKNLNFKFKELIIYFSSSIILFIPAILVLIISLGNIENDQGFILWGKWAFSYAEGASPFDLASYLKVNIIKWYVFNTENFGFFLFPISLLGLIVLKKKYNINIFLYLFISHFIISFLMAGFTYAQSRTLAYLMPVCSVGISVLIYFSYKYFISIKKNYFNFFQFISYLIIFFIIIFEIILGTNKILKPELIKTDWSSKYTNKNNHYHYVNKLLNSTLKKKTIIITDTNSSRIILSSLNYPNKNINYLFSLDSIKKNKNYFKLKLIEEKIIDSDYNLVLFLYTRDNNQIYNKKKFLDILCNHDVNLCNVKFLEFNSKNFEETNFKVFKLVNK